MHWLVYCAILTLWIGEAKTYKEGDVLLMGGSRPSQGTVLYFWDGKWGAICDSRWGYYEAASVCKKLQFEWKNALPAYDSFFGESRGIKAHNFHKDCRRIRRNFTRCKDVYDYRKEPCKPGDYAGVECQPELDYNESTIEVRLVENVTAYAGGIEIRHNGQWGAVCGGADENHWNLNAVKWACRKLGFSGGKPPHSMSLPDLYPLRERKVWHDKVFCRDKFQSFSECIVKPWGNANCNSDKMMGVMCDPGGAVKSQSYAELNVRLVDKVNNQSGLLEVLQHGLWGAMDHIPFHASELICKKLGFPWGGFLWRYNDERLESPDKRQYSGSVWHANISCVGNETRFEDCIKSRWVRKSYKNIDRVWIKCSTVPHPAPPVVVKDLENIKDGDVINATCSSGTDDRQRFPTLYWYCRDYSCGYSSCKLQDKVVEGNTLYRSFTIKATKSLNGKSCQCTTRFESLLLQQTFITFNVAYSGPDPVVTMSHPVRDNHLATVTCNVTGFNPLPEIFWYRNNTLLYVNSPLNISRDSTRGYNVIQQYKFIAKSWHSGKRISCVAYNRRTGMTVRNGVIPNVHTSPVLAVEVRPKTATIGGKVSLSCDVQANPMVFAFWRNSTGDIVSPLSTFTLESVSAEDSGQYNCFSNDIYGNTFTKAVSIEVSGIVVAMLLPKKWAVFFLTLTIVVFTGKAEYIEDRIVPDKMLMTKGFTLVFNEIKLSWNDALDVCSRSNRQLVVARNESELLNLPMDTDNDFTTKLKPVQEVMVVKICMKFSDGRIRIAACRAMTSRFWSTSIYSNSDLVFDHKKLKREPVQEVVVVKICMKFRDDRIRIAVCRAMTPFGICTYMMWIGLSSISAVEPNPWWISCDKYDESAYEGSKRFESENNTFNAAKRCGLLRNDIVWEWRDCSEAHGFACTNVGATDFWLSPKIIPACGENDDNSCPHKVPPCSNLGLDAGESLCVLPASTVDDRDNKLDSTYMIYKDVALSWNEAFLVCRSNGYRLAVLNTQSRLDEAPVIRSEELIWIGLYWHVPANGTRDGMIQWVDCNEYQTDSFVNVFEREIADSSSERRCVLIHKSYTFEWRDCAERHGFMCERTGTTSDKEKTHVVLDKLGDTNSCPNLNSSCGRSICTEPSNSASGENTTKAFCVNTATSMSTTTTAIPPTESDTTASISTTKNMTTTTSPTTTKTSTKATTTVTTQESTTSERRTTQTSTTSTTHRPYEEPQKVDKFSCNTSCNCRCNCVKTVYVTPEELVVIKERKSRWIASILDDLSLNKSELSNNRLRYKSAEDPRESVTTLGSLGVIILVVVLVGILLLDISALIADLRKLLINMRYVFYR